MICGNFACDNEAVTRSADCRYTLTNGIKFGGHFLAYQGDPDTVHAAFVVRVQTADDEMTDATLSAGSRAAAGARKRMLLAVPDRACGNVTYTTFTSVDLLKE